MPSFTRNLKNRYFRYIVTLLSVSLVTIAAAIAFNINYTFSIEKKSENILDDAIAWQARSKGVIATQTKQSRRLKDAQLERAISSRNIDTLVLGSSSLMGIRSSMFPKGRAVFNGAKNSNPLHQTLAEARYYINRSNDLKWIIIGFDWELGYPYLNAPVTDFIPEKKGRKNPRKPELGIWRKIKDAVTYQRVKIVLSNLKSDLLNPDDSYPCPREDNLGKDIYTPPFPRTCYGFRYDGSATFSNFNGLTESKWHALLKGLQKYKQTLVSSRGVINGEYLTGLVEIDQALKKRGGGLVILLPAMIPQAVSTINQSDAGRYLERTLADLSVFAEKNDLLLLDASQSEQFGCEYGEFLDPHHGFDICYTKILSALYR